MTSGLAAVPVTVLTGFLGAGKTTLLNRLLRLPILAGAAVIVNEFGDIGIDHLLVDAVDGDMLMLTTGCLCCMARGDLVTALVALMDRRAGGSVTFDRIIIETTGLADPGPVLNALLPTQELGASCRLDKVLTVVDAVSGLETLETMAEAVRQVALADVLVLSKTDRLPDGSSATAVASLEAVLRHLNPAAPVLMAQDTQGVASALRSARTASIPELSHTHGHLHGIETVSLRAGRIEPQRFEAFLDRLVARHGPDLLRMKGLVASSDDPDRPVLVNVVQHRIHPATRLDAWPDEDRDTRFVVIARQAAASDIADLWAAFFGPPRIDQPDAAALSRGFEAGPGLF